MVPFPPEWTTLPFARLQEMVLAQDRNREEATVQLAGLVRYIHDEKRYLDDGHESFKDWCEAIDRTDRWGRYMCEFAELTGIAANPRQARELSGLSTAAAQAVKEAAEELAGSVTSATLAEAREQIVPGNRRAVHEIELGREIIKVHKYLLKVRDCCGRHGEMPEWFLDALNKQLAYCTEQRELDAA